MASSLQPARCFLLNVEKMVDRVTSVGTNTPQGAPRRCDVRVRDPRGRILVDTTSPSPRQNSNPTILMQFATVRPRQTPDHAWHASLFIQAPTLHVARITTVDSISALTHHASHLPRTRSTSKVWTDIMVPPRKDTNNSWGRTISR